MTPKQRLVNCLKFQPMDRPPMMEIAVWPQTRERWLQEGMPAEVNTTFMHRGDPFFGLEGYETVDLNLTGPVPAVKSRTIAEDGETVLFVDSFGRTRQGLKVDGKYTSICMDRYIAFPVKDRTSFKEFRRRYEGPAEERYPKDWEAVRDMARATDLPLTLMNPMSGTFGYYSMLRNWFGTEALSYLWYDDPDLIHECLDFLTDFAIRVLTRAVREIRFDYVWIHEDMAGKGGPLMGPDLFRKFLLPHYLRYVEFLKTNGVQVVLVDTDGDHRVLTPLFLEAGVDGFGPLERAAGMDPVEMRRQYGKSVCMSGGVDKRAIAKGRAAINAELKHVVAPIINQGGFIPTIDHAVPPDVSFSDFQYYLDQKRKIIFG